MWPALPSFIDTGVTRKTSVMSCAAASLGNGNFQLHYNFRSLYHICGSEYCHVVRGCTRPISLEDVREKSNGVFFPFFFFKNVASEEWSASKFSCCPRLLYSAALLHMDQAALYRAMKALRLLFTCMQRGPCVLTRLCAAGLTSGCFYSIWGGATQFCARVVDTLVRFIFVNIRYF